MFSTINYLKKNYIIANLLIAIAYFALAYAVITFKASVLQNFAHPFWPAAGIAMAGVILFGYRALPGIYLGDVLQDFLVDTSTKLEVLKAQWGDDTAWYVMTIGVLTMSLGPVVSAYFGRRLLEEFKLLNDPLVELNSIVKFYVIAGPIASLFSAAISIGILYELRSIDFESLSYVFYTWYTGDCIGVFIVLTLVLAYTQKPKKLWRTRTVNVAMPLAFLIILLMFSLSTVRSLEHTRYVENFDEKANNAISAMRNEINRNLDVIATVENLIAYNPDIDQRTFSQSVNAMLSANKGVVMVIWAPEVQYEEKQDFMTELNKQFASTADFDKHYMIDLDFELPIYRIAPVSTPPFLPGKNILNASLTRHSITQAIDKKGTVFSQPEYLSFSPDDFPSILAIHPVKKVQGIEGKYTSGVLICIINYSTIIQSTLDQVRAGGILIRDVSIQEMPITIYQSSPNILPVELHDHGDYHEGNTSINALFSNNSSNTIQKQLQIGNRDYQINILIPSMPPSMNMNWQSRSIVLISMPLFLLLTIFLTSLSGRSHIIEKIVDLRTSELNESNKLLELEVEERIRTEQIAKEHEELLSIALNASRAGAWDWDISENRMHWDANMFELFATDNITFLGTRECFDRYIHPDDLDMVNSKIDSCLKRASTETVEFRIPMNNNQIRYIEMRMQVMLDDQIEPSKLTGICMDATARKEQEQEFMRIFNAMDAMNNEIFLIDAETLVVTYANNGAVLNTGYPLHEIIGNTPYLFAHEFNEAKFRKTIQIVQTTDVDHYQTEARQKRKDGSIYPVDLYVTQMAYQGKSYILAFAVDTTERKKIEEEKELLIRDLAFKNEELEQFNYTLSHDLKSPLVTMQNFLAQVMMALDDKDYEDMRHDLVRVQKINNNMYNEIEDFINFSKAQHHDDTLQTVLLSQVINETLSSMKASIEQAGVQVHVAPSLPAVVGYPVAMREIFFNLIDNAVKYSQASETPVVEIFANNQDEDFVYLHIKDNGIGIEKQYHDSIFNLFQRVETSITGSGIGLALVKRLVESQHGQVSVASDGIGLGTTFTVKFYRDHMNINAAVAEADLI